MKRWIRVNRTANGHTVVTVTLQSGNLTAKYSQKCAATEVKGGAKIAHGFALRQLADLEAFERSISDA